MLICKVYHPNINDQGKVCLNILRQEWMPVLSLGSVIFGLMTLFLEPNPDDPLDMGMLLFGLLLTLLQRLLS